MVEIVIGSFSRAAVSASSGACDGLRIVGWTLWPARPKAGAASNPIPLLVPVISTAVILVSLGRLARRVRVVVSTILGGLVRPSYSSYQDQGCPTLAFFVQSHDILYKVSLDILYTPGARNAPGGKRMAWKTMDVYEQRVRFVVEATQRAWSFGDLCAAYEISRPTGYLWLQRYREQGVAGIAEQSRKPHHSPRRTARELEQQVTELRSRYPDWGARKLQVLLARQGVLLPRNTIHRILRRHDLVGQQERGKAAVQRFERSQPNQLWQMDFKGPKGWPPAHGTAVGAGRP